MKCGSNSATILAAMSRPIRGAWIEIIKRLKKAHIFLSRPIRGAWIEI